MLLFADFLIDARDIFFAYFHQPDTPRR